MNHIIKPSLLVVALVALLSSSRLTAQWKQADGANGQFISSFVAMGQNIFAAAWTADKGGVYRSSDAGATWAPIDVGFPLGNTAYSLATNGAKLYAGTDSGLFVSSNNGDLWTKINTGLPNDHLAGLVLSMAVYGNYMFAGTNSNGVIYSSDQGVTWTKRDSLLTSSNTKIISSLLLDGSRLYAGIGSPNTVVFDTTVRGIYLSTNLGLTWSWLSGNFIKTYVTSMLLSNQGTLFAGLGANPGASFGFITVPGGLLRSTNNGTSWSTAGWTLPDTISVSCLAKDNATFFAGTSFGRGHPPSGGVYLSIDDGLTWKSISNGLPGAAIYSLFAYQGKLLVGTAGYGIWYRPLSEIVNVITTQDAFIPNIFLLNQNYPNPFNPSTVISYQLPTNSYVTLKLYDVLGREVNTLVSTSESAGNHSVTLQTTDLPSAVYLYTLQAGNYTQTKKLILIK